MALRKPAWFALAGSKVTFASDFSSDTSACTTPGRAFSTFVTLRTHPPQVMPFTFSAVVSIFTLPRKSSPQRRGYPTCMARRVSAPLRLGLWFPAFEEKRIGNHRDRRQRHGGAGDYRIEHAERGERNAEHVVKKSEEQVLTDLAERRAGQPYRIGHAHQVVSHQRDVGRFDGDIRSRADGEADVGSRQRRGVVDAISSHRDQASGFLEPDGFRGFVAR